MAGCVLRFRARKPVVAAKAAAAATVEGSAGRVRVALIVAEAAEETIEALNGALTAGTTVAAAEMTVEAATEGMAETAADMIAATTGATTVGLIAAIRGATTEGLIVAIRGETIVGTIAAIRDATTGRVRRATAIVRWNVEVARATVSAAATGSRATISDRVTVTGPPAESDPAVGSANRGR